MQFLDHLRPRLILFSRTTMWAVIGLFITVGIFQSTPAWAEPTACTGNSTIPIAPHVLFLRYGGPASTYEVSLCEEPDAPVDIVTTAEPQGLITIDPASFSLSSTVSQTVSVAIPNSHPADQPFTVMITHTATSDDPSFDHGSLNVPRVTAYYSPPVAMDDTIAILHGQSVAINVKANDTDRLGQGLTLPPNAIVTPPTHGTATLNVDQTIQYVPMGEYSGPDTFTYRINDGINNTDIGTVFIDIAEENVTDSQVEVVDPAQDSAVEFESSLGDIRVEMPALVGVSADSTVAIVFSEVETTSGDVEDAPVPGGTYSGIVFKLQVLVNGVPITPGQLSEPLRLSFTLPEEFAQGLNGARIIIAVWDGTSWVTDGVAVEGLTETLARLANVPNALNATTLTFSTTVFGEFAVFTTNVLFMPSLERQ